MRQLVGQYSVRFASRHRLEQRDAGEQGPADVAFLAYLYRMFSYKKIVVNSDKNMIRRRNLEPACHLGDPCPEFGSAFLLQNPALKSALDLKPLEDGCDQQRHRANGQERRQND